MVKDNMETHHKVLQLSPVVLVGMAQWSIPSLHLSAAHASKDLLDLLDLQETKEKLDKTELTERMVAMAAMATF